jgi:hypothetical protein
MPCNTTVPDNKNEYDKYISKVVRHLLFIHNELNIFPSKELTKAYAQSKFSTKDGEFWIMMLCERLTKMSKDNLKLFLHKKDSKKSKKLLDWWECHKEMDKNT